MQRHKKKYMRDSDKEYELKKVKLKEKLQKYLDSKNLPERHRELYVEMYTKQKHYKLKEICDVFRPHYLEKTDKGCVFSMAIYSPCGNIHHYSFLTDYREDWYNNHIDALDCLFTLFALDEIAKDLGLFKTKLDYKKELLENSIGEEVKDTE